MRCDCDKRINLKPYGVDFACHKCNLSISHNCFSNLTVDELKQVKKECDYYILEHVVKSNL